MCYFWGGCIQIIALWQDVELISMTENWCTYQQTGAKARAPGPSILFLCWWRLLLHHCMCGTLCVYNIIIMMNVIYRYVIHWKRHQKEQLPWQPEWRSSMWGLSGVVIPQPQCVNLARSQQTIGFLTRLGPLPCLGLTMPGIALSGLALSNGCWYLLASTCRYPIWPPWTHVPLLGFLFHVWPCQGTTYCYSSCCCFFLG